MPRALLLLLIVTTLARLALAGLLDLGQDEAYALAVSRSFQWSFFDHPPLAFWTAGLMQALFGRELPALLLRLPFVLMFTGSTWAMFALTRRFYGVKAGLWAATLLNTAPFFFASTGSWVVPDGPLMLTLLLATVFLARALGGPDGRHWADWLAAGLFVGLALLSKYQAVLVLCGALIVLVLPANRRWLARPQPYAAVALALLLSAPVIAWNAANGWVSFGFQLGRGGGSPHFDGALLLVLLGGEAAYLLPWVLVALVVAAIRGARRPAGQFFLVLGLPTILLFNILPLIGAHGLPHWSMAGWLLLFPALGDWLAATQRLGRSWPGYFRVVSVAAMAVTAAGAVSLVSDWRIFPGDDGINHYLIEATSWSGVREGFADQHLLERPHTFLAGMSWLDAAHIAEALRPSQPPVVLGDDPRGFAFVGNANAHLGEDAYFVVAPDEVADATRFAGQHFDSVEVLGSFETWKGGMPAYSHTVLLAHHFAKPVAVPYGLK